jgi:hypothetical protein
MTTTTMADKKVVGVSVFAFLRDGVSLFWTVKGLIKEEKDKWDLLVCDLDGNDWGDEAKLAERLARKVMEEGRKPNFKKTRPWRLYLYAHSFDGREDLDWVKEEIKKPFQVVELGYFLDDKTIEEELDAVCQEDAQDDPNVAYFVTRPKRFGLKVYKGENWNRDGSLNIDIRSAWVVYKNMTEEANDEKTIG